MCVVRLGTGNFFPLDQVNLYSWNGNRWQAILPCANCGLHTAANLLTVELDHLTDFALGFDRELAPPVMVTLTPVADTYIFSGTQTANYGPAPTFHLGRQSNGTSGRAL